MTRSEPVSTMKYRLHFWTNLQTGNKTFGIQCQPSKGKRYMHLCDTIDGTRRALIYRKIGRAREVMNAFIEGREIDTKPGLVPLQNSTKP